MVPAVSRKGLVVLARPEPAGMLSHLGRHEPGMRGAPRGLLRPATVSLVPARTPEIGGCWCRSGLVCLLEVIEQVTQTGDRSLNFSSLPQLSARSFIMGYAHPEELPLSAMVRSPQFALKSRLDVSEGSDGCQGEAISPGVRLLLVAGAQSRVRRRRR